MSNNKMLVDASHPEETRVVVLRGNRIEEFDFESASKKPLRGNIYLAKVTRVEPSLQAAFVDYGGNRHGFLAFSEIHPDYYQIPVADRQALLEEEAREQQAEAAEEENRPQSRGNGRRRRGSRSRRANNNAAKTSSEPVDQSQPGEDNESPAVEDTSGNAPSANPGIDETVTPVVAVEPDKVEADAAPGTTGTHSEIDTNTAPANQDEQPPAHSGDTPDESAAAANTNDEPQEPEHSPQLSPEDNAVEEPDGEPVEAVADPDSGDVPADNENQPDISTDPATGEPDDNPSLTSANEEEQSPTAAEPEPANLEESPADAEPNSEMPVDQPDSDSNSDEIAARDGSDEGDDDTDSDDGDSNVENLGGDTDDDVRPARRSRRHYKIQEVIKRRQILLVQVVKEERGNKGAALTSYLSLAGRYSVLMPNTARGGGISRKITDSDDRRRMKDIAQELEVPEGMGVILRTAGASRTKPEVRRDFEYLLRLWESVREMTLQSSAPALVYEEGSLVKRSIRDLYGKGVDEILVAGEEGHREAKDFMKMLMPSQTKNVKLWTDPQPLFAKSGVETQLDAMFSANVNTKSGGYIVINQTEALVAIDVNSGRSTREHNIEDTALRTNLEAADEIARQLRLRDLAGLIVVDFIDMEENRNNRAVERRLKEALKSDRARIQVGHISHFGLLEMSRQRMRTGVLEGSSIVCPFCQGGGSVRSTASIALHVLRLIEDALIRNSSYNLTVKSRSDVAMYMLNQKRAHLSDLEQRFGVALAIEADDHLSGTSYHSIERGEAAAPPAPPASESLDFTSAVDTNEAAIEPADDEGDEAATPATSGGDETGGDEDRNDRKRRRRRRGRGRDRDSSGISAEAPQPSDDGFAAFGAGTNAETDGQPQGDQPVSDDSDETGAASDPQKQEAQEDDSGRPRRRRRGFRGRRRGGNDSKSEPDVDAQDTAQPDQSRPDDSDDGSKVAGDEASSDSGNAGRRRRPRRGAWVKSTDDGADDPVLENQPAPASEETNPSETAQPDAPEQPAITSDEVNEAVNQAAEPAAQPADLAAAMAVGSGGPVPEPAEPETNRMESKSVAALEVAGASENGAIPNDMNGTAEPHAEAEEAEKNRKREVELLPEAPPPAKKRSGWWQK